MKAIGIISRSTGLLLCLFLLGFSLLAQDNRKKPLRLNFSAGVETIHMKGMITGKGEVVYLVRARKGQRLAALLHLKADQFAALQVRSPDRTSLVSEDGTDAGLKWNGVLKKTGEHRVIVFGPETADRKQRARFLLEVSLK